MIYGIGVDCVQVERIQKSLASEHFAQRVFSAQERELFAAKNRHAYESAAGCFAAKEAFLKAAGTGIGGYELACLAALRSASGAPYFALTGSAAEFCSRLHIKPHLSITHEAGLAIAYVVLEIMDEKEGGL